MSLHSYTSFADTDTSDNYLEHLKCKIDTILKDLPNVCGLTDVLCHI